MRGGSCVKARRGVRCRKPAARSARGQVSRRRRSALLTAREQVARVPGRAVGAVQHVGGSAKDGGLTEDVPDHEGVGLGLDGDGAERAFAQNAGDVIKHIIRDDAEADGVVGRGSRDPRQQADRGGAAALGRSH
jgi:hypothetical protein